MPKKIATIEVTPGSTFHATERYYRADVDISKDITIRVCGKDPADVAHRADNEHALWPLVVRVRRLQEYLCALRDLRAVTGPTIDVEIMKTANLLNTISFNAGGTDHAS